MTFFRDAFTAASDLLPRNVRDTLGVRAFGLARVPMILFCMPTVEQLDERVCSIIVPLNWRTRNHYKSMYFGALAVGADVAGGLAAMHHVRASGKPVNLLFKDFQAEFIKRPQADVRFRSDDGEAMAALVAQAIDSGERVNGPTRVVATTPSLSGDEPVARFVLTVSLKLQRR